MFNWMKKQMCNCREHNEAVSLSVLAIVSLWW